MFLTSIGFKEMFVSIIFSLLLTSYAFQWKGYHTEIDDELPSISWKDCGISVRNCDPNTTFKDPFVSSRIYGGENASTGEYPWFIYLEPTFSEIVDGKPELRSSFCGGAILNEWWVLTAAHCVEDYDKNQSVVISIGSIAKYGGRRLDVEKVVIPLRYYQANEERKSIERNRDQLFAKISERELNGESIEKNDEELQEYYGTIRKLRYNLAESGESDIALLKVKNRIFPVFNQSHYLVNSICLPKTGIMNEHNESLVLIGMGKIIDVNDKSRGGIPPRLKKGMTVMLDRETCRPLNIWIENSPMICLVTENPTLTPSTMQGDSGSPSHQYLNCKAVHMGITSYGQYNPRKVNYKDWFIRVSMFVPWIRSKILSLNDSPLNVKRIASETNHLLIVSVITTTIIAVVLCFTLLWISFRILTNKY